MHPPKHLPDPEMASWTVDPDTSDTSNPLRMRIADCPSPETKLADRSTGSRSRDAYLHPPGLATSGLGSTAGAPKNERMPDFATTLSRVPVKSASS